MNMRTQHGTWQPGLRAAAKGSAARCTKGFFGLGVGICLAVCSASGVGAGTTPQEPNGVIAQKKEGTAPQEPNGVSVQKNEGATPQEPNGVSAQENDLLFAKSPTTPLARQVWQARMSTSKEEPDDAGKDELQKLIQKVGSMQLKPRVSAPKPEAGVEPAPKAEPNETAPVTAPLPEPTVEKVEIKLPEGFVSEQTVQLFNGQLQPPESLKNPFEMAEILYSSGRLKEAALCYQEAVNRFRAEDPDPLQNKAWALLQWGNCLRKENPQAAMEKYKRVVAECPGSLWAGLASAQSDFVEWYLKEQPKTLVNDIR